MFTKVILHDIVCDIYWQFPAHLIDWLIYRVLVDGWVENEEVFPVDCFQGELKFAEGVGRGAKTVDENNDVGLADGFNQLKFGLDLEAFV